MNIIVPPLGLRIGRRGAEWHLMLFRCVAFFVFFEWRDIIGFIGKPDGCAVLGTVKADALTGMPLGPARRQQRFILRFFLPYARGKIGLSILREPHSRRDI